MTHSTAMQGMKTQEMSQTFNKLLIAHPLNFQYKPHIMPESVRTFQCLAMRKVLQTAQYISVLSFLSALFQQHKSLQYFHIMMLQYRNYKTLQNSVH